MKKRLIAATASLYCLGIAVAYGAGLTNKADNVLALTQTLGKIVVAVAFLAGIGAGFMLISLLMKKASAQGQQVDNFGMKVVVYFLVMVIGIGYSSFVMLSADTVMGDDTDTATSIESSDFGL